MTDDDRDDLGAYLDGELDAESAGRVEARLRADPAARAEAEALKRAWDLLDVLPRAEPSVALTHRTLQRVEAVRTQMAMTSRQRHRVLRVGAWLGGALAAAAVGFVVISLSVSRGPSDEDVARDLRVLEHLRLYEPVDDIDFLKALDHADLFGDDPETGG